MSNRYHLYLDLPVPFAYPEIVVPNVLKPHHAKIDRSQLGKEFVGWIHSLGLMLREGERVGEYFYTPANGCVPMHTDKHFINDAIKLNWMVGGESSTMDWYELVPGKSLTQSHTDLKTAYAYAQPEDVVHAYGAKIGGPSLVNVGRLHSLTNGPEPSHVYCVYVDDPTTGKRLQWDDACRYFSKWMRDV